MHPDSMVQDAMEDVFLQDNFSQSIAEHALQCDSLFRTYMAMPDITPDPTVMDDQLARFTLWASNMDVFGPPNISLDYRLRYSPTVVEIMHQLLSVITSTLNSLKPIDDPPQSPSRKKQRISENATSQTTRRADDDASDADSDDQQAEENVSKINDTIGGTVTRLFRLSNAVRKSAAVKRAQKIGSYTDDQEANNAIAELRLYTDCYIGFRFPQAPDSLRSALVEANALRLRRLYYQRSHRRRIGLSVQHPQTKPTPVQLPKTADNTPVIQFTPSEISKPEMNKKKADLSGPPPVPLTTATTARQTAVGALYAKSTTEVPQAKSVLVNNKLSFPPIPPSGECPYCGVIVEFRSTAKSIMWHDHVIRDLEPFVCVFTQCTHSDHQDSGPLTFETSLAWMSHLQNAHGSTWECRAPSHDPVVFEQEVLYQEHAIQEHGVPKAHVSTLSNAARRSAIDKIQECPFGDEFQPPEKIKPSAVFASEALHSHVAAHMKEIALLALQKLPSDADDDAESIDSDRPLEDDGPGFAKLRGSMFSVLDDEALDYEDEFQHGTPRLPEDVISPDYEDEFEHGTPRLTEDVISPLVGKLDLEDKDADGMTKLHHAVKAGDLSLIRTLIDQGASLRTQDNRGRTVLHYASEPWRVGLDLMTMLLKATDQTIVNLADDCGQTPLHYAVARASPDEIQLMADHGAAINILDNSGFSPFLWAVVAGRERIAGLFLKLGANVNSASSEGKSALGWAASLCHATVAQLLVDNGADIMSRTKDTEVVPLEEAAASGDLFTARLLLYKGANINYRDRDGWSAIHFAAEEGHWRLTASLIEDGADVNAVSSYGTSPLHCAANGGHTNIVNLLLQHGASPLRATCHGWTPLHHAAFMGGSDVVHRLLEDERMRFSASQQDNHGWTVLHLAVHSRDLTTVRLLLTIPVIAKTSALCDESGLTAGEWLDLVPSGHSYKAISNLAFDKSRCCRPVTRLREAVVKGNIPLIELFLSQYGSVNERDSERRTALYYAAKKGQVSLMDKLLKYEPDPYILPKGRKNWEEFISDDAVLSRLTKRGYENQSLDPEVDYQIRLALKGVSDAFVADRTASNPPARSVAPSSPQPQPGSKSNASRSGVNSLWKRLRGQ